MIERFILVHLAMPDVTLSQVCTVIRITVQTWDKVTSGIAKWTSINRSIMRAVYVVDHGKVANNLQDCSA